MSQQLTLDINSSPLQQDFVVEILSYFLALSHPVMVGEVIAIRDFSSHPMNKCSSLLKVDVLANIFATIS